MIFSPKLAAVSVLLILLTQVTDISAQDQSPQEQQQQNRQQRRPSRAVVSIDFAGGTVQQYIVQLKSNAIASNHNVNVNVILDESVKDVVLPGISFTDVPLDAAIQVLEEIGERGSLARVGVSRQDSIFVINAEVRVAPRPRQKRTTVISVSNILETKKTEDLLSAIEIGMNLIDGGQSEVNLKLHSETGLLFAKGSMEQLNIISEIVDQLTGNSNLLQQQLMIQQTEQQQQRRNRRLEGEAASKQDK